MKRCEELFLAIGGLESARLAKTEKTPHSVKRPKPRLVLIAAVIALAALLVGCAALYVLHLQDMAFAEEQRSGTNGSTETWFKLSLQGVEGTRDIWRRRNGTNGWKPMTPMVKFTIPKRPSPRTLERNTKPICSTPGP